MTRTSLLAGSVFAALAVILGAMGAHTLKQGGQLTDVQLNSWDTGAKYQMYHAIALIAVGILAKVFGESKILKTTMWMFIIGVFLFSGSLYLLSTAGITGLNTTAIGPITPFGGLFFITGWFCLILNFARKK